MYTLTWAVTVVTAVILGILGLLLLTLIGWLGRVVFENPRGDFESGFALAVSRLYCRAVHLLRVRGRKRIPAGQHPGPMIVVCNHTAGIDPILVQAACPFYVRWLMAQDMRTPRLEWFWTWWDVMFVDRIKRDSGGLRQALRHLKAGGVVGIFPEGGLERPPKQILPFQPGIGMLVKKTGARVLTVTVDGTPQVDPAWASLWNPSKSIVHFRETIDYTTTDLDGPAIAEDLRRRFVNYTGWTANNTEPGVDEAPGAGKKGRPVPARAA